LSHLLPPLAALPFLRRITPTRVGRLLALGEIATGGAIYLRSPALHQSGSVWASPPGIAVSKDVFMLGIRVGLLLEAATEQ
jgi:hypothetical protein